MVAVKPKKGEDQAAPPKRGEEEAKEMQHHSGEAKEEAAPPEREREKFLCLLVLIRFPTFKGTNREW